MSSFQRVVKYIGMGFAILLAVSIIGGICAAGFGITGAAKHEKSSTVSAESGVYDFAKFTSMDIDCGVADVIILTGDDYRVETMDVPDTMTVEVKNNGTLVIKTEDEWYDWFDWFDHKSWNKKSKVYITVPNGYDAEKISISSGTGHVDMSDISTEVLDINGDVGDITGSNIKATEFSAQAGVGNIDLSEVEFGSCDVDCGVGSVTIRGVFTGDCDFDGGVGDMEITVEGSRKNYDLDIESGVGSVRVNGEKVEHLNEDNDSKVDFKVDGGVGSVDIDFTED